MADNSAKSIRVAFAYVTMLFFVWGAVTSINDVLIPAVKLILALSGTESFFTQFAFFMAYGVVSLPAAAVPARLGSAKAIVVALVAAALCLFVSHASGPAAGVTALSVGLFNAATFPVIFTLTIERSSAPAWETSGLMCMAIVGGAFVPFLFAHVADATGSRFTAFLVPMVCCLGIAGFMPAARRVAAGVSGVPGRAAH